MIFILDYVIESTNDYLLNFDKSERKNLGQFFTSKETSIFMSSLFNLPPNKNVDSLRVLDPGAGTGILSAALISSLQDSSIGSIDLTVYENDMNVLGVLEDNLEYIKRNSRISLNYNIVDENFIISNKDKYLDSDYGGEFDFIIANPPYKKFPVKSMESQIMGNIVYGAPNIYSFFTAMSTKLLKDSGEMVIIIPRSWTSGAYFKKFRHYLLDNIGINQIHLFVSRNVFKGENVLQETLILHLTKNQYENMDIVISSCEDYNFNDIYQFKIPKSIAISSDDNKFVYLPTNEDNVKVLDKINNFKGTLVDYGIKLKTGLTIDYRYKEFLLDEKGDNTVPIFYPCHFKDGFINFPVETDKKQYLIKDRDGLLQENKDYLFIKRFTSKEEKRRLQPAIYLKEFNEGCSLISTDNKINFIDTVDGKGKLTRNEIYGLFVIFNSTLYDQYYRILNGNTQVNATEINSMSVPSRKEMRELGVNILDHQVFTTDFCDKLLGELL